VLFDSVLGTLIKLVEGESSDRFTPSLTPKNYAELIEWELQDRQRLEALGILEENIFEAIAVRLELLKLVSIKNPAPIELPALANLWRLTLPLALQLVNLQKTRSLPLIQGIVGVQGSGKSTLVRTLKLLVEHLGLSCLAFSLDDLYKTYSDRLKLQATDPRIIWRGVPGTHDLDLGIEVLQNLRKRKAAEIPRFDKSAFNGVGDRQGYELAAPVDIVLFEGWFVGMRSLPVAEVLACNSIDPDFSQDMNRALDAYLPLWQLLDRSIVIYPQDYRWSIEWRQQAEREMTRQGKSGMSDRQVEEFVKYFWSALPPNLYFEDLLRQDYVDLVVTIDRDRHFGAIY
jgi:D-glycerate 3-kinase